MNNTPSNTDPHRAAFKTLGAPDYAAQETMHHLLSPRLHSSSFTVMPVSLNGSHRVQINLSANKGQLCCSNILHDIYANRAHYDSPDIDRAKLNFVQFATQF